MNRKTIFIAAGVLLAAGAVAAVAAQGHRGGWRGSGDMPGMEHDDRGRGGFHRSWRGSLTQAEHDTRTRERFARLDRNSDGVIDAAEVEAAMVERMGARQSRIAGRMGERLIRRFDEDRDGKVTREEFNASVRKRFAEMDLNNDQRIGDEDLPPLMRGRGALTDGQAAGGGPGRDRGGRGGSLLGLLRGADANKDGAITLEEAQTQAGKMFAQFDRTKDNVVDQADFDALRKETSDYRVQRFIHHFGADKDGKVTREQFDKVAKQRFAMRDLNNDGTISRDEMPGRGRWGGRGPGMGSERGPGPGGPGAGPGRQGQDRN